MLRRDFRSWVIWILVTCYGVPGPNQSLERAFRTKVSGTPPHVPEESFARAICRSGRLWLQLGYFPALTASHPGGPETAQQPIPGLGWNSLHSPLYSHPKPHPVNEKVSEVPTLKADKPQQQAIWTHTTFCKFIIQLNNCTEMVIF